MQEPVNASLASTLGQTRAHAVLFVRSEARRWQRFAAVRSSTARNDARSLFDLARIEKRVLSGLDGTLKVIAARVRARLSRLDEKPARRASRPSPRPSQARKTKHLPPIAA
jgi:hypothetical protein